MKFLFVCGGTAGHINPALSVAQRLRATDEKNEFLFIGSGRDLENRLIPAAGFKIKNIKLTGVSRKISIEGLKHNIGTLKKLVGAGRDSKKIIKEFKPDIVIGTGGYVCYPVLKEAKKAHIPTLIHESNAIPGLTTKMVSGFVNNVLVAFPGLEDRYKDPKRVLVTGTPIRDDFNLLTKEEAKNKLGIGDMPLVVSFWGSLGATGMNSMMTRFIERNCEDKKFFHIHATGGEASNVQKMKNALSEKGVSEIPYFEDIRPYIDNMGLVMTAADIVLCRSGASTLAELTAIGCPAVLVPSPNVVDNHQEKNARELEKAGAAVVITENDCTGDVLFDTVAALVSDKDRLSKMSADSVAIGEKDAVSKIIDVINQIVN